MLKAFQQSWQKYVFEALGLGLFMMSACLLTAFLEYPNSVCRNAIPNADVRRLLLGLGMGLTAMGIVYSPFGKRSGAHINPAVTLTFLRLGKISAWNAAFYMPSQVIGAVLGVVTSYALLPRAVADPAVRFAVTVPGKQGTLAALVTEFAISFVLMSVVLFLNGVKKWANFTGVATGLLVASFVFFAAPISGFGMNPARTIGSAIVAHLWTAWWVYLFAPPIAMLLAAEIHLSLVTRDRDGHPIAGNAASRY